MRLDKEAYLFHIKDINEQAVIRKVLDKIEISISNHSLEMTDFLDPYERYLALSILNRFDDLSYTEFGGIENGERKIITIYPYYYDSSLIVPKLRYFRIHGDIDSLSHKDFLGGLLGIGINRSKVGDIQVHNTYADITIKAELGDFVLFNLKKIGCKNMSITEIELEDLKEPVLRFKEIKKFVTSLRLDVLLSAAYNFSRQESINIIKTGKVKINWQKITKPSKELALGDTISTKGFGRIILYSNGGMSKKGRYLVTIRILT
ncbi:MAG: RNA-binding protein [Tissierellia bacterium]|nr:RNA-binding protein [Tissierellia bacterium]